MTLPSPAPFTFADLKGKTVLLSGADRGIGLGLVPTLLAQGLRLILLSLEGDPLNAAVESAQNLGGDVQKVACDLSDPAARARATQQILSNNRSLDGIIHNAAIDPRMTLDGTTLDLFRHVMATNVEPAVELTRDLLPLLKASHAGRVLMMGSVTFELGTANLSAYVASKGAIEGLTRSWAHELGTDGITVNCIAPGAVKVEKEAGKVTPEGEARLIENQSLQRRVIPDDLAGIICLLLSEAGSAITGQTITVDGGLMHPIAAPGIQAKWLPPKD